MEVDFLFMHIAYRTNAIVGTKVACYHIENMSIEVIPQPYDLPFDPLAGVDHDRACLYTYGRLTSGRGVREELQSVYTANRLHSPELINRLLQHGKFLESYDADFEAEDQEYMRTRVFGAGTALALAAAANMAFEAEVDQFAWRKRWIDLPSSADAPVDIKIDASSSRDDFYRIGSAIMEIGHRNLTTIEEPYRRLVEDIDDIYASASEFSNIFKASYGYVFGSARRVISETAKPLVVDRIVANSIPFINDPGADHPIDQEYKELIERESNDV